MIREWDMAKQRTENKERDRRRKEQDKYSERERKSVRETNRERTKETQHRREFSHDRGRTPENRRRRSRSTSAGILILFMNKPFYELLRILKRKILTIHLIFNSILRSLFIQKEGHPSTSTSFR